MSSTSRHENNKRPGLRRLILLVLVSTLMAFLLPSVCAQEASKKVLIFSSEDQHVPAISLINQSLRTTLRNGSPSHVQLFYEALDSFRIPNEKYEQEMVGLIRRKYDGEKIDLVFALGPPALRFLLDHQSELFSGTPIV